MTGTNSATESGRSRNSDPTILGSLDGHNNSLGLLRLIFALAVIVSHSFLLGGFPGEPRFGISGLQETLGGAAVAGGIIPWTIICIGLAFGMAWLSWNLVERPALSLKSIGHSRVR